MCIPQQHWDVILQNVLLLRHSLGIGSSRMHGSGDMSQPFNRMSYGNQGMGFKNREMNQPYMTGRMDGDSGCYSGGSYSSEKAAMMRHHQQQQQQQHPSMYIQQGSDVSMFKHQTPSQHSQLQAAGMSQSAGMGAGAMRPGYAGQVQGGQGMGQANVHQSHPHLRNTGQNPQDIANNILQMANCSYPTNNTVQVPLTQNRTSSYHMSSRSPHYNHPTQDNFSPMTGGEYNQGCGFMYSGGSGQLKVAGGQLSPSSPASGTMMTSPHSHHSGASLHSSSPCSLPSPGMGAAVRSPMSDMSDPRRGHYPQPMVSSPQLQGQQACMMSGNHGPRLMSPTSPYQQLQVSVSGASTSLNVYRETLAQQQQQQQQYMSPQSQRSSQYSPPVSTYGQYGTKMTTAVDTGQYGPISNSTLQVSSPCSQYGNLSSPYTPGSQANYNSPPLQRQSTGHVGHDMAVPKPDTSLETGNNPLQSLEKLCMLPKRNVIDPKSVVKETCIETTEDFESQSQSSIHSSAERSTPMNVPETSSIENECVHRSPIKRTLNEEKQSGSDKSDNKDKCSEENEFRCQPKKARLMKAVQDDSSSAGRAYQSSAVLDNQSSHTPQSSGISYDGGNQHGNLSTAGDSSSSQYNSGVSLNDCAQDSITSHKAETAGTVTTDSFQVNQLKTVAENTSSTVQSDTNSIGNATDHSKDQGFVEFSSQSNETQSKTNLEVQSIEDMSRDTNVQSENSTQDDIIDTLSNTNIAVSDNESQSMEKKTLKLDIKTSVVSTDTVSVGTDNRLCTGSTCSASEGPDTSDYEYDHIGCDDIDNDFSDIDDSCVAVVSDGEMGHNVADSDHEANEAVLISGSNWKKNKVCPIPSKKNGAISKGNSLPSLCYTNNRRSRAFTRVAVGNSVIDSDLDSIGSSSPYGGDMVDGPVGIENGDGTLSVVSTGRVRQRKTPVKYKDTSFFQGDFVFIEEEESYLQQYKPKKKGAPRNNAPTDVNHNPRQNSKLSKASDSRRHRKSKSQATKEQKDKSNIGVNSVKKSSSPTRKSCERNLKDTLDQLTKQAKRQLSEVRVKRQSLSKSRVDDQEKDSGLDVSDSDAKKKSNSDKSASVKTRSTSKLNISTPVTTRKSSRERAKNIKSENGELVDDKTNNDINGIKNEPKSPVKMPVVCVNNVDISLPKSTETKSCSKRKEETVTKSTVQPCADVITIDSDTNDGSTVAKNEDSNLSANIDKMENEAYVIEVNEFSHSDRSNKFKFTLVEDDSNLMGEDSIASSSHIAHCVKRKKPLKELCDATDKTKTSGKGKTINSSSSNKVASAKRRNKQKKRTGNDSDPDFDMEPMKKSLKSVKAQADESKKRKVKKDKWANFKGPKIVIDGDKDTPNKCLVINDPFDEIESKKSKVVTQNVTRIEISQLPSDKSVLIPNSENLDKDNWVCALCGKHSSYKFLGDLFGPYTVEKMSEDLLDLSPTLGMSSSKKRRSDDNLAGSSKAGNRGGKRSASVTHDVGEWKEVWVHECCAVYSDGVFLIGNKIYGIQEAVRIASQTPCTRCHELGAMIGCLNKGCHQKFHHYCAQEEDCYLDEENFSLLCPKHKVKKLMQLEASTSGVS